MCKGYETIPKIQDTGLKNYTFGGIIDYVCRSNFSQKLWGTESLGDGNNLVKALYSNNFSHRMSYAALGKSYLQGHGLGSSYILETYADFGYFGIIIFSIILGMLFCCMERMLRKGGTQTAFALIVLTDIYFCPRGAALAWLQFTVYLQFLIPAFLCWLVASLSIKEYDRKKHIKIQSKSLTV